MSDEQASPKGVIAIVTNAHGDVIATCADFDRSGYGGFKLWQAQKMRAGKFAAWATIKAYERRATRRGRSNIIIEPLLCEFNS